MEQAPLVSPPLGGTRSGSAAALFAGRYRVQHLLGRVGTAQLHQGWDELLERPVTVKVFDHATDTSGGDLGDQPELQHLTGLSHPGLITVLDAGTEQPDTAAQRSFLVLERVRGTTLLRRLNRGPLPAELVAEIGQQLATTLAYLHQHGLVHGGVHPAAVLLSTPPSGHSRPLTVKLSDAGTAHVLQDTTISPDPVATCPGPDRRPEQVAEADLRPAGDIFCLALLLLQALPGRRSDPGAGSADAGGQRAPIIPEDLDPGWAPLLAAMTHPDPTTRPPATEIADVLGTLAQAPPVVAESPPLTGLAAIGLRHHPRMRTPHRHPHRRWLPIPAAAAILLTGLVLSTSTPPTPTVATTPAIPAPPAATATAAPATNAAPAPLAAPAAPAPALTAFTPMQATTAPTPPPQATPSTPPPEQQATAPPPQTTHTPSPPEQATTAPTPPPQATPSTPPPEQTATTPIQAAPAPPPEQATTAPTPPPQATPSTPPPEQTATTPIQAAPAPPPGQVSNPPTPAVSLPVRTTAAPTPPPPTPAVSLPVRTTAAPTPPPPTPAPPPGQVSNPLAPVVSTAPSAAAQVPSPVTAQQLPGAAVAPLPTLLGIGK